MRGFVSQFAKGDRVIVSGRGAGTVTLKDRDNVGVSFDSGLVGCYGWSYLDRFPGAVRRISAEPVDVVISEPPVVTALQRLPDWAIGAAPERLAHPDFDAIQPTGGE